MSEAIDEQLLLIVERKTRWFLFTNSLVGGRFSLPLSTQFKIWLEFNSERLLVSAEMEIRVFLLWRN